MNHAAAKKLLIDLVDGTLEPEREQQVRTHLSECPGCSSWLETYEALSSELSRGESTSPTHPGNHEIATYALDPDSLSEFARARLRRHLETCSSCATEVRMVRLSVDEGPDEADGAVTASRSHVPGLSSPSGIGLAAMLLLLFGVVLVTQLPDPAPSDLTLDGGQLDGRETISATRTISVVDTAVTSGAALTLKSESVAFGDGFSVENSAALVVVTDTVLEDS